MSRTFVSRIIFRFLVVVSLLTIGWPSHSDGQDLSLSPAPTIPSSKTIYTPRDGQTFHALIDDVIVRKPSVKTAEYYSQAIGCWLKGPAELPTTTSQLNSDHPNADSESGPIQLDGTPEFMDDKDEEAEWATLLTCHCPEKRCVGNECQSASPTITESPACRSTQCTGCPDSNCPADIFTQPTATENETFCNQVAQLLANTLENSETTPEAKKRAIESAMKMVADNATAVSEAKLKDAHKREIKNLQFQLDQASDQAASIEQIKSWLRPIYSNQNRNFEQMKLMNATQLSMNQSLRFGQFSRPAVTTLYPSATTRKTNEAIKHSPYVPRVDNETAELARLRAQLDAVNRRIEKLQSKPVQQASYLEPVYVPNRRLDPIYSTPDSNEPYNYRR